MLKKIGRDQTVKVFKHFRRNWLDLDVIDTTYVDQNVHLLRHSYWNINKEIIEDMREMLVGRKRAAMRSARLDRKVGNVFMYRVAPSCLTSLFD